MTPPLPQRRSIFFLAKRNYFVHIYALMLRGNFEDADDDYIIDAALIHGAAIY